MGSSTNLNARVVAPELLIIELGLHVHYLSIIEQLHVHNLLRLKSSVALVYEFSVSSSPHIKWSYD